ncbi:MAG: hypothetical protein QNL33_17355 [Akkermansiaceae bacterium]
MKNLPVIFFLGSVSWAAGNEALNLLDQESGGAGSVYQDAVRAQTASRTGPATKAIYAAPDPFLADRWDTEMDPRFAFEVQGGSEIAPRGLFEYQYHDRSIARGARLSRARVGVALQTYYGIEVLADALLSSSGDYLGWESLRASVPLNDQLRLSVGKFPPPFSTEYSRDASLRWFPNLSPLVAQVAPASSLGAMLEGRGQELDWKLGWFGSGAGRSLPTLDGKGYLLASVAHSSNRGGSESSSDASYHRWHLDYLYNMVGEGSESIVQRYRHLVAAGVQYSAGRFDFYSDLLLAQGAENTVTGVTAAGSYWLLQDAIRLVARYDYARSRDPGGVVSGWGIPSTGAGARHPNEFPISTMAGQMFSIYGGLNFHLDDDHFIIGTGLEYRSLSDVVGDEDFSSWGWNTFARYSF